MQSALIQRAGLLLEHERYADAETLLRENLAIDPDDATCMRLLGICHFGRDNYEHSLQTFDRALALAPEDADLHVWRARVLLNQNKPGPAHRALDAALRLEPDLADAVSARAMVFYRETKWVEAEATARAAMALDSDDVTAQNILSHALMMQGRQHESEAHIRSRLERDPENGMTHVAAGYAALRRGDHENAATHFSEALRLDPENEAAREGLLNSFRARSVVYRSFLAFSFRIARLQMKYRQWLFLGAYVVYQLVVHTLKPVAPGLAVVVMIAYGLFVLWSYVATGIGTLFILGDSRARLALRPREKWEGILVGGGSILGLILVLTALAPLPLPTTTLFLPGLGLLLISIPWSLALSNFNATGRKIYGALALTASAALVCIFISLFTGNPRLGGLGLLWVSVPTALSTFMALLNFKRVPD